ncbi:HlyD family type I secretion periplasmic adaptor subunit [Marinobacterium nitratireducens]|uniref:Membrane fusion protein (MFP) family protein n=1 Tax=Marinobacterium nitratireducens TaxID=518897 RepID=A0A917ZNL8_9GAMM|nr:HlyD family type I secretion periplasmic adaptor subunit [Marinobacterium nitratireducens]GGO86998.1 HlyD family type I secretion periplasmic adaptor subunit [Marinobacterium nitratireducens]
MNKPTPDITSLAFGDNRPVRDIATLLDNGQMTSPLRRLLLLIVLLVLVFLVWAALAEVDELARARGEVQPITGAQLVQSQEGGMLTEILVRKDEFVREGQPIARFAATDLQRDRAQALTRQAAVQLDLERWGAIAEDREPDFNQFDQYPVLMTEGRALYENQIQLQEARTDARRRALEERKSSLQGLETQLPAAKAELAAAVNVLNRTKEAAVRGLVPKIRLAESEEHTASTRRQVSQLEAQIEDARKAIATSEAELQSTISEFRSQAREARNELVEKLDELHAEIVALDTRQGRSEVVSPVDGFVQEIPQSEAGAVIAPGGTVAQIIPSDSGLLMEVMVSPRDIGFVEPGQAANIKIDAFNYSRFGSLEGSVKSISPTVFRSQPDSPPFYKVQLELAQEYVGSDSRHRLIPGMTGEADIATGRKSVLQYLLKPVFITADTAFHER